MTIKRNVEDEARLMIDDLLYRRQHGYAVTPNHTIDTILLMYEALVEVRKALIDIRLAIAARERQGFDGRG